jgi:hypothetical protein
MAPRERISVNKSGLNAEGPRTSMAVTLGGIALLTIGFFTGHWTALINACLGIRF